MSIAAACGLLGWGDKRMANELGVSARWVYDHIKSRKRPKRHIELALMEILRRHMIFYATEVP